MKPRYRNPFELGVTLLTGTMALSLPTHDTIGRCIDACAIIFMAYAVYWYLSGTKREQEPPWIEPCMVCARPMRCDSGPSALWCWRCRLRARLGIKVRGRR